MLKKNNGINKGDIIQETERKSNLIKRLGEKISFQRINDTIKEAINLKNPNEIKLKNGTIIRTDIKKYKPIPNFEREEYRDAGIISDYGDRLLDTVQMVTDKNERDEEVIKKSEKAVVCDDSMAYLGGITSREEKDGVCYVRFQDEKGNIRSGYFIEDAVRFDEIYRGINKRIINGEDFKKGDLILLNYGDATILGRIKGKKGGRYKIEIGIISIPEDELKRLGTEKIMQKYQDIIKETGVIKGMGIIERDIAEINKFNSDKLFEIKNRDEYELEDGTIVRTDIKGNKLIPQRTAEEYRDAGIITDNGYRLLYKTRMVTEKANYDEDEIDLSEEKAVVDFNGKIYYGGIIEREDWDGVCYVKFQDEKGKITLAYFVEDAVRPDEIRENIKNRKGNFKKGDNIFLRYGNATILGRVRGIHKGKNGDKYEIEIGTVISGDVSGMGIIKRDVTEINKFNDDIVTKLENKNEVKLEDGTVIRKDIRNYRPRHISELTVSDYIKRGIVSDYGEYLLDTRRMIVSKNEHDEKEIKNSKKAVVYNNDMAYLGGITSREEKDGVCYVKYQNEKGDITSGYFIEDAIKTDEIFEDIRNRKGNFKKGDNIFLRYGDATILGRIKGEYDGKYKIEIGIITKYDDEFGYDLRGMGIVERDIAEINKFNDDIVNEKNTSSEQEESE